MLTGWHLIRESLGKDGLKKVDPRAVGDKLPREMSHGEGQTSQTQPSEKKT
jgi:hypothetical protein